MVLRIFWTRSKKSRFTEAFITTSACGWVRRRFIEAAGGSLNQIGSAIPYKANHRHKVYADCLCRDEIDRWKKKLWLLFCDGMFIPFLGLVYLSVTKHALYCECAVLKPDRFSAVNAKKSIFSLWSNQLSSARRTKKIKCFRVESCDPIIFIRRTLSLALGR